MAQETKATITDGPSKFNLMMALFNPDLKPCPVVSFDIHTPSAFGPARKINVRILEVGQEDGSGNRWVFEGLVFGNPRHLKVKGYFSTQERQGWIRVIETPSSVFPPSPDWTLEEKILVIRKISESLEKQDRLQGVMAAIPVLEAAEKIKMLLTMPSSFCEVNRRKILDGLE